MIHKFSRRPFLTTAHSKHPFSTLFPSTATAMTTIPTCTTSRRRIPTTSRQTMVHRKGPQRLLTHKMVCIAAAAALSTSSTTQAWLMTTDRMGRHSHPHPQRQLANCHRFAQCDLGRRPYGTAATSPRYYERPLGARTPRTDTTTRLYASSKMQNRRNNNNDDDDQKSLFGFRKAARKVLPTKWFGTREEKEALERKKMVKDRVQGELDEMLKGAPLPLKMFGKYVAAPMMGKIASKVAEAGLQQQETMQAILEEAKTLMLNDPEVSSLLGTPLQMGMPLRQMSSTTVINGRRQMRTEFAVEVSGPMGNGVSRIVATEEGIGQLLVESNGRVYNVDLTSKGRMSSSTSSSTRTKRNGGSGAAFGGGSDDNIIEAEIIDKDTK